MNYALPNPNPELLAASNQPPERPSYESWMLALCALLSFLGGMTGMGEIATPIANCLAIAAMFVGIFNVGRWAYHRFRYSR